MKKLTSVLIAAILAVFTLSLKAQVTPSTPITLTNVPTYIIGGATSNITAQAVSVAQGQGIGVVVGGLGTNAATTDALTLYWSVSRDGSATNFTTAYLTTTASATGVTQFYQFTNLPPAVLNNTPYIALTKIVSAANATNTITNLTVTLIRGNPGNAIFY
jgi:hypothetical protein